MTLLRTQYKKDQDQADGQKVSAGSIFKYMVLPRILPRIGEFISTGFQSLAFFIACVFSTARLLPSSHPYLRPANIGQFGIIHVITAAASSIQFKKENIDQIIIFTAILSALVLLAVQVFSLMMAIVMPSAMAQIATILNPYTAIGAGAGSNGEYDIAMILLDRVFGVPGLFNSCVSLGVPCVGLSVDGTNAAVEVQSTPGAFPWPFHEGLHQMYLFYSSALMVVGVFIFIYFVMVVLIETAQTGTPFGRRFNSVWAPIRMVAAIGLLFPFAFGMNSAQFIVLYAAKWGSGLATTAWFNFNNVLVGQQLTSAQELVGTPQGQNPAQLLAFMSLVHACAYSEEFHYPYTGDAAGIDRVTEPWLIKAHPNFNDSAERAFSNSYQQALDFYGNGNVIIRFGVEDPTFTPFAPASLQPAFGNYLGWVEPSCGEIIIPTTDLTGVGASYIREAYYNLVLKLFAGPAAPAAYDIPPGDTDCNTVANLDDLSDLLYDSSEDWMNARIKLTGNAATGGGTSQYFNDGSTKTNAVNAVSAVIQCIIDNGVAAEIAANGFAVPQDLLFRGWAGAGIWYNRIAAANGAVISAAGNTPAPMTMPMVMERVAAAKVRVDPNVVATDMFNPEKSGRAPLDLPRVGEAAIGQAYYQLMTYWTQDMDRIGRVSGSGNFFANMLMGLFGLEGLYSIRDNADVHPLAKLVGVGKTLIDATIRNLTMGTGLALGSAVASYFDELSMPGALAEIASEVMFSAATIGLTAGFVLYYVVPFLPFIYFFFAVGNWLKTVFEAMVGVPLWALAHIRIDGNGLPGDAAVNGYYLIFEIFLRPLMVIFGLIAGISVFAAMAAVLHDIWDIVLANVGGTGPTEQATFIESIRGPVDKLFYLVVYTIILYMMAVSSFKLVELIPQQILRWMGANVPTFVDQSQDAAGSLVQYAAIGGGHMFGQLTSGTKGAISALKK